MNYFKISQFFLYLVPFAVVVVSTSTLFPFIVGKYVWFRTTVDLSLLFFLLGLLLRPVEARDYEKRLLSWLKSPIAIALGLFCAIFIISSFFAFDAKFAFWSNFERGEGGFQMLHLFLFFVLAGVLLREEKAWRKIFWFSVIAGFLMIFYGIGAGLKYVDAEMGGQPEAGAQPTWTGKGGILFQIFRNFIGPNLSGSDRFQGSIGNPAYVATFLIFMFFYSVYLILNSRKKLLTFSNLILGALILIFGVFFVLTGTRGAFVGLLAALFFGIIYLIFIAKKWRLKLLIFVSVLILLAAAIFVSRNTPFIKSTPVLRIFNISLSARTFQDRTYMWRTALEGFKERPILGWGPENFVFVFDTHFPKEYFTPERGFGAWFDRAHSVFFDYLAETGVLGFLSYLSIFIVFYLRLFAFKVKGDDKNTNTGSREYFSKMIIFVIPIAYLVQGLVLFEVLAIYLNLFLFFAFANFSLDRQRFQKYSKS